ncbi:MAG: molybdenum cofactor biosynthesis protein MoaE [Actinobacteria bacterium]|nr:molybdenum cofactor biosynthesis protein MoaE [Actinomycetota bacterium]
MTDPPRGAPRIETLLTTDPLDVAAAHRAVADPTCGGTTVFTGSVRDHHEGAAVERLEYEAWEERAAAGLREVGEAVVRQRTSVRAVYLAHRLGPLDIGEVSVVVAASAPHRAEAFTAARDLIDRLKAEVPIWKHEFLADGTRRWPGADGHPAVEDPARTD